MAERVALTHRLRNTGVVSATPVLAAFVAFLVNVLMARTLGPASRGDVAFVLQIAYFVTPITLLGLERRTLRDGGVDPRHLGGFVLLLNIVVGFALAPWLGIHALLVAGVALAGAVTAIYRAAALNSGAPWRFVTVFVGQQAVILLAAVSLAVFQVHEWQWWALGYCAASLPFAIMELISAARREPRAFDRDSLILLPSTVAALIVLRADRILLGSLATSYELGLYVTVATASEPVYWVAQAIADRRSSRSHRSRIRRGRDMMYFASASCVVSLCLYFLITPVFGDDFQAAESLVFPLGIAGFFLAMFRQSIANLIRVRSSKHVTLAEVVTASLGLICYVATIPSYGALGAAWASAATYALGWGVASVIERLSSQRDARVAAHIHISEQ